MNEYLNGSLWSGESFDKLPLTLPELVISDIAKEWPRCFLSRKLRVHKCCNYCLLSQRIKIGYST